VEIVEAIPLYATESKECSCDIFILTFTEQSLIFAYAG